MSFFELQVKLAGAQGPRLDLDVTSEARAVGVFGPSGAGKTTLIEAVCGLLPDARARICIDGHVLASAERSLPPRERGLGWVPQDVLLFPHLDVRGNILAGARAKEDETYRRALAALEIEELTNRSIESLSGGEQRRVALARAVCSRPKLLVLDEPLSALDQALRRRVLPYLLRVRHEFDLPLLLVTHEALEVHALCDEVICLERGRAVRQGPPAEVLSAADLRARDFENLLPARVQEDSLAGATMRALAGSRSVFVLPRPPAVQAGGEVLIGIRADEILIATAEPVGISARNVLPAVVGEIREAEGVVYLTALLEPEIQGGPALTVSLTEEARRELALEAGREVFLILKTQSCRVMRADRGASSDFSSKG